jgi:endoglycosylceramidase
MRVENWGGGGRGGWLKSAAALALLACGGAGAVVLPRVTAGVGSTFVEAATGRQVVLHGTAVENAAGPPFLDQAELNVLTQQLGFNILRVGFHWHLYEPNPGQTNATYLAAVKAFVESATASGLYVFLDMHQDSMSPFTCGHGLPWWASSPLNATYWTNASQAFPQPWLAPVYDPSGNPCGDAEGHYCPVVNCAAVGDGPFAWATAYLTEFVGAGFQRLYTPASENNGTLDAYAAFWREMATTFRGVPGLLAYELINEPWLGDVFNDPDLLIPGVSDAKNLQPFYAALTAAIRAVDNDTMIFFEPATGGNLLDATPAGFSAAPDANAALSGHIYCPLIESDMPYENVSQAWSDYEFCQGLNALQVDVRYGDARRYGVPWILSEFGAVSQQNVTEVYLSFMADLMDAQPAGSWTYWLLSPAVPPQPANWEAPFLSRTYARRVPGTVVQQSFSYNATAFSLTFTLSANATTNAQPLELFASRVYHYPRGFSSSVSPTGALSLQSWDNTTSVALFLVPSSMRNSLAGTNITLTLLPK